MQPIDEAELPHAFLNAPLHPHSSPQLGLVAAYGQISVQTSDSDRFLFSNMTDPPQITRLLGAHTNCGVLCLTPQLFGSGPTQLIGQFCVLLLRVPAAALLRLLMSVTAAEARPRRQLYWPPVTTAAQNPKGASGGAAAAAQI